MRPLTGDARAVGTAGEALAAGWLERQGYRVLARNYRCRGGEVDVVADDRGELVFVEVRTRRAGGLVGPEESVTRRKQERLVRAAEHYLQAHGAAERPWRVDLVAIEVSAGGRVQRVEHYRSILEWA
ncbi:MAG TPA: YraN family protein [Chloroflexota bacterium]